MLRLLSSVNASKAPVFTVDSALRWLGHDCANHCRTERLGGLDASVWFIWLGRHAPESPPQPLVLIHADVLGLNAEDLYVDFSVIERCVRDELIHVRLRLPTADLVPARACVAARG